jgi:hypothetical protein
VPASSAGYSGTPLASKLGIKPGHRLMLLGAPENFAIPELPDGVTVVRRALGTADVIVSFHTEFADYARRLPKLRACMAPATGLWIAWPKRASKVPTDLGEVVIRDFALQTPELVDNKVCAIDEVWSGLRLVIRLKDRP